MFWYLIKGSLKTEVPARRVFFKLFPKFLKHKQERTLIIFSSHCKHHVCVTGSKAGATGMSCIETCILWKTSPAELNLSVYNTLLFPSCKPAYLRARHSPAYKHSWEMNTCAGSMEWWHTTNSSCYRIHFVEHAFLWTKLQPVFTTCQRAYLWCGLNMSTHFLLCIRLEQCLCMTWALSPCHFISFCVW